MSIKEGASAGLSAKDNKSHLSIKLMMKYWQFVIDVEVNVGHIFLLRSGLNGVMSMKWDGTYASAIEESY